MVDTKFVSNNYGVARVIAYGGTRSLIVEWLDTGHQSVVQKDAASKGLIVDHSRQYNGSTRLAADAGNVARVLAKIAKKQEVVNRKVETVKLAKEQQAVERIERLRKAAEVKSDVANKVEAEREARHNAKIAAREAKELAKLEEGAATWKIDNNRRRKNVVEVDFKTRSGFWVLQFQHNKVATSTRLGKLYNNMSSRSTIGGSRQLSDKYYRGVTSSTLFQDPQTFCDWAVSQPGWGLGWQLDKDLLCDGVRRYSEDACVFLPYLLNMAINGKNKLRIKRLSEFYKSHLDPRAYNKLIELST